MGGLYPVSEISSGQKKALIKGFAEGVKKQELQSHACSRASDKTVLYNALIQASFLFVWVMDSSP